MNKHEASEFEKRGVLHLVGLDFIGTTMVLFSKLDLRKPNKLDKALGYASLAIPAAMLARVVRKVTGRKGTPLEKFLMDYYYNKSVKLLARKK